MQNCKRRRKWIFLLLLPFVIAQNPVSAGEWAELYRQLLDRYVVGDRVDYARWAANAKDTASLVAVTNSIGTPGADVGLEGSDLMGFRIDGYNAWMLRRVIENYPISSVLNIQPEVFETQNIAVSGIVTSLNDLEKKFLLREFNDKRIHFAVNCASIGCPPLSAKPFFKSRNLDDRLNELTGKFLKSNIGARLLPGKRQIEVSQLFDWYAADFGGMKGIKILLSNATNQNLTDWDIVFFPYDWNLNDAGQ